MGPCMIFFIGVEQLYNVVLVSPDSMNQLTVYTYPLLLELPLPNPPSRSSQSTQLSSQYYTAASYYLPILWLCFPMAQQVKNLPAMQETQEMGVRSLGREDPLEEDMATHSSILAWRIPMDRGAWRATV